jgi:hypothetical protein
VVSDAAPQTLLLAAAVLVWSVYGALAPQAEEDEVPSQPAIATFHAAATCSLRNITVCHACKALLIALQELLLWPRALSSELYPKYVEKKRINLILSLFYSENLPLVVAESRSRLKG